MSKKNSIKVNSLSSIFFEKKGRAVEEDDWWHVPSSISCGYALL